LRQRQVAQQEERPRTDGDPKNNRKTGGLGKMWNATGKQGVYTDEGSQGPGTEKGKIMTKHSDGGGVLAKENSGEGNAGLFWGGGKETKQRKEKTECGEVFGEREFKRRPLGIRETDGGKWVMAQKLKKRIKKR